MAKERRKLTQAQWEKIETLLSKSKKSERGGRPWADNRKVFEGIFWILRAGALWADLPKRYPSPSTYWRPRKIPQRIIADKTYDSNPLRRRL
ncbi:transposase [Planctomycetota bacterium]